MPRHTKTLTSFQSGRGYSENDWQDVSDNPEWDDQDQANAKPFTEFFPEISKKMQQNLGGRPKKETPKQAISIRLDADVLAKFRATGPGWQSRINEILKAAKL